MPIHRRHSSKAGEWSGQELVPSRLADDADSEVWFAIPREGEKDQVWEALSGRLTESGLVELRAVPALAYGVAFGDQVSVIRSAEGSLVVDEIRERSSFATFRIWLGEEASLAATRQVVAENYAKLGCLVDVYSEKLIALACPEDRAETVRGALESQASVAGLVWEESSSRRQ
jgi:hypothetical protein